MICIFAKGATKRIIASPKSAGWKLAPGDEFFPDEWLKTEAAFIKRWKALEKNRYQLVKFTS